MFNICFMFKDQTLPGYYNPRDRLGVIDYDDVINTHRSRVVKNQEQEDSKEEEETEKQTTETTDETPGGAVRLPQIHKTAKVLVFAEYLVPFEKLFSGLNIYCLNKIV